jgi:hypothetical protein
MFVNNMWSFRVVSDKDKVIEKKPQSSDFLINYDYK